MNDIERPEPPERPHGELVQQLAGAPRAGSPHPNLHDGWRVQIFTDAAALSAERGGWVELEEIERHSGR